MADPALRVLHRPYWAELLRVQPRVSPVNPEGSTNLCSAANINVYSQRTMSDPLPLVYCGKRAYITETHILSLPDVVSSLTSPPWFPRYTANEQSISGEKQQKARVLLRAQRDNVSSASAGFVCGFSQLTYCNVSDRIYATKNTRGPLC